MKRLLILLSLPALLAGGVFWLFIWLQNDYLPARLADLKIMGQPARVDSASISAWFPPAVTLHSISWQGQAPGGRLFFSAQAANVVPDIFSFLRGEPELLEIVIDAPVVYFEKNYESSPAAGEGSADAGIGIGRLVAQNGSARYVDDDMEIFLDDLRLTAENLRPKQEMSLQSDFGMRLTGSGQEYVRGNFAVKARARYYSPHITVRAASATFTATGAHIPPLLSPCGAQFDGAFNLVSKSARIARAVIDAPVGRMEIEGEGDSQVFGGKGRLELDIGKISRWSGTLAVDSPFILKPELFLFQDAIISLDKLQVQADVEMFPRHATRIFSLNGHFGGDGVIKADLKKIAGAAGHGRQLNLRADKIDLGYLLEQTGLRGIAGGSSDFNAVIETKADKPDDLWRNAKGKGTFQCGRISLEPFGEMSILMPLLGASGAILPTAIDSAKADLAISGGSLEIAPFTATGPGFSARGQAEIDFNLDKLNAALILKARGLEVPLVFAGPLDDPGFKVDPSLLKKRN